MRLLEARLSDLQHAPFFSEGLKEYLTQTKEVIAALQGAMATLDPAVTNVLTLELWTATQYLSGSVSREVPYEIVYGLESALADWLPTQPKHIVTTAFLAEQNYLFMGVSDQFYPLVETQLGITFTQRLVQVALPQLYKHLPINNSVLYHELGHFIDDQFGISAMMAILAVPADEPMPEHLSAHTKEHFADLFAACYVGDAISEMLDALAPNAGGSYSHPATSVRTLAIRDFLAGRQNQLVDLCNDALAARNRPALQPRGTAPDVIVPFDNMRPCTLKSKEEVHGVLPAALRYLKDKTQSPNGLWVHLSEGEITRVVNDLVEKSIRNWMISEKWAHAST